jgi:hypothetical protein
VKVVAWTMAAAARKMDAKERMMRGLISKEMSKIKCGIY